MCCLFATICGSHGVVVDIGGTIGKEEDDDEMIVVDRESIILEEGSDKLLKRMFYEELFSTTHRDILVSRFIYYYNHK